MSLLNILNVSYITYLFGSLLFQFVISMHFCGGWVAHIGLMHYEYIETLVVMIESRSFIIFILRNILICDMNIYIHQYMYLYDCNR